MYPLLTKQYKHRTTDTKHRRGGTANTSHKLEQRVPKGCENTWDEKGMKGSLQRPLNTGCSECSKMPLNYVEKGNDTILSVLQKEKT